MIPNGAQYIHVDGSYYKQSGGDWFSYLDGEWHYSWANLMTYKEYWLSKKLTPINKSEPLRGNAILEGF